MQKSRPLIFAIKHYALHDGPNIRTTVFFKGCPLKCFWCHNPEGIGEDTEVITIQDKCIGCNECVHGCPEQALRINSHGVHRSLDLCTTCLNCVEICPSLAQEAVGWHNDIDTLMQKIEQDTAFFDQSGGGVTFSGGEPLMQAEHLIEILRRCGQRGIHRAVDTTGYAPESTLLAVAEHMDLCLFDLKHMDDRLHRQFTGVGNQLILQIN